MVVSTTLFEFKDLAYDPLVARERFCFIKPMDECDFGDRPYGGGSVMIWDVSLMIASWTWSPYEETGDQYLRYVLQPVVVHHFDSHPIAARPVIMDDNARPHRSMAVLLY